MSNVLPDLLTFADGRTVTAREWQHRRDELYKLIVPHEYGGLPPTGNGTLATRISSYAISPERRITFETYEVRTTTASGHISFILNLWIPAVEGQFPVILTGDGCWRFFNDEVAAKAVNRGFIAASFNRTSVAYDNPDRYQESDIYQQHRDKRFGAVSAWAWAYHRCVDVLETLPFVRGDSIAITGHSRGGKTVLLAAATDTRIAAANPHCSGTGGSGLNRVKGEGAEVIEDFHKSRNIFWFGKGFAEYRNHDNELPYDQHFLHALIAPRCLLVSEAREDVWANPEGSRVACSAVQPVYELLDAGEMIQYSIRDGGHDQTIEDFTRLLDFLKPRIRDRG
jgi:hypothetical protein